MGILLKFDLITYYQGMEQKDRDKQKDKYCKNHNIKLIRILYTNHTYKEIKEVLDSNLSGFM